MDENRRILIANWPSTAKHERSVLFKNSDFLVERIDSVVEKPFTTYSEVPSGYGCLIFTQNGNALIRGEVSSRWYLVPQRGVTIRKGPKRTLIREGRGNHVIYSATWKLDSLTGLAPALEATLAIHRQKFGLNGAPFQSLEPHFVLGFERFLKATQPAFATQATAILTSVIAEAVAYLGESKGASYLAPTPPDLPQTIEEIILLVRESPDQLWPLKLASDHAGYSPFHFSRTFKQLTGYGFHEFVDRTRTEFAVELLCATDEPVDSVSVSAGFGTTQGMRESMREYLGLVPSEVRAEPEESLIS